MLCVKWKARRGAAKMKSTPENSSGAAPLTHTWWGSQESRKVVGHRLLARASAWGGWGEKVEGGGARLDTSVLQRARMETFGPFEHSGWVKVNDGGQWDFFTSSGAGTIGQRGPTLQSIPARFLLLLRKC